MKKKRVIKVEDIYWGGYEYVPKGGLKSTDLAEETPYCPNCITLMVSIKCKLKCLVCGFQYDCADVAALDID